MKYLLTFINIVFISLSFYGQNDTISIIKHTDKDIIVNKESKVVYRGISNSLSIEVPNCKSFTASADGLTMVSKNLFDLNPGAGSEVVITIGMVLKNNKKKTEKHIFKIKNFANIIATFNNINQNFIKISKSKIKGAILNLKFDDDNLKLNRDIVYITNFYIKLPDRKEIEVYGNYVDDKTFELIDKFTSRYDKVVIFKIGIGMRCGLAKKYSKQIILQII